MGQNMENVKRRQETLRTYGKSGSSDYFKEEPGQNIIRIVPPKEPREDFWLEGKVRYGVGPNNRMIVCPTDPRAPDPAKEEEKRLLALGDEVSKKRADSMKEKNRCFMWVVNRNDPSKGVMSWNTNMFVLRDILAIMADSQYGDVTDPDKGFDLTVTYTPGSKGTFPQWNILPFRNPSPLGYPELLEEDLFEVRRLGKPHPAEYVQACLDGTDDEYWEAKRAERAAAETPGSEPEPETQSAAPAGDENAAVQAELDKIRNRKAAKASPPPPPADATPPPPPAAGTPNDLLEAQGWYAVNDGQTVKVTGQEIQAFVDAGKGDTLICHGSITGNQWKSAKQVGFVGAGGPPPAPQSQVGKDLADQLK